MIKHIFEAVIRYRQNKKELYIIYMKLLNFALFQNKNMEIKYYMNIIKI